MTNEKGIVEFAINNKIYKRWILENIVTKKIRINKGIDYFWYQKEFANPCMSEANKYKADVRP